MISKEILKKIRKIEITTSKLVTEVFAGQYHSIFKGRGIEFEDVREYQPGDDIRSIDWNVTARTGEPFVKKYVEERELTVVILLDVSSSSAFGSGSRAKSELAAEIVSLLALSANRNNDKVGLINFSDRVERAVPPRKGIRHILRVIREAYYHKPEGKGTDIAGALEYLNRVLKRRAIVFLISDFLGRDFKKALAVSNRRHDVVGVRIIDPCERDIPNIGIVRAVDPETDETVYIDTGDSRITTAYRQAYLDAEKRIRETLRYARVDTIDVYTDRPYTKAFIKFFKMRAKRLRV